MSLILAIFLTWLPAVSWSEEPARAGEEIPLLRRLVVFPLQTDGHFTARADEAWWTIRDELTFHRRLLVASRQFLIRNDVFQPRGQLNPADAILLGKLLDAHALITTQLVDRKLKMQAFDGGNGALLWAQELTFSPSLPIGDQLAQTAKRLARDFEASIPSQGHVVIDPLVGTASYNEGGLRVLQVDFGPRAQVEPDDAVQVFRLQPKTFEAFFQGGATAVVFAEGIVLRINQGLAIVKLERLVEGETLGEFQMVRAPKEMERLAKNKIRDPKKFGTGDLVVRTNFVEEKYRQENRPVATTLSVVASIAAFLLLAF